MRLRDAEMGWRDTEARSQGTETGLHACETRKILAKTSSNQQNCALDPPPAPETVRTHRRGRCDSAFHPTTNPMTTTKLRPAMYLAAVALIGLATEKLVAQDAEGNPYSPTISMAMTNETSDRTDRTSHSGIIDPVGLRPNEQATITLSVPSAWVNFPVGIAPLDGGEVFGWENLHVGTGGPTGGRVSFGFKPGSTTGLYRVMVSIGGERYELQLYLPRPGDLGIDCVTP